MPHPIGKAVDQEIERRRIKREIARALALTDELRAEVRKIEAHFAKVREKK